MTTITSSAPPRQRIDKAIPVRIRLSSNEEVVGVIEFYDANFIRITREDAPNLFLYKHDIKYLYEVEANSPQSRTTERGGSISETTERTPPRPVR